MNPIPALFGLITFALLYALLTWIWQRKVTWQLSGSAARKGRYVHFVLVILFVLHYCIAFFLNVGLFSPWPARLLGIATVASGTLYYFLFRDQGISKPLRIYFQTFSYFPSLVILLFFMSVYALLFPFLITRAFSFHYENEYSDQYLRVQQTFATVEGGMRLDVIEKIGPFAKRVQRIEEYPHMIEAIEVSYDSDSTRIRITGSDDSNEPPVEFAVERLDD